jgi:hypothetical protein
MSVFCEAKETYLIFSYFNLKPPYTHVVLEISEMPAPVEVSRNHTGPEVWL